MPIELYPSIAKIKRNGVYENLPGFVPETGSVATQQMIATAESSATAQYVHNKGEYFRLNDTLYQAIVKINVGDSIVVGTNCEVAVIGNDLTHVANSIAAYELGIATSSHNTGDYFMVGETMYVATADIQVGDNISTSTNCRKAVVGDELSGLKTALTQYTGNAEIQFSDPTLKQYINTSGSTVSWDNPSTSVSTNIKWAVVECSEGDKFTINGKGGNADRLWAFADSSKNILSKSGSGVTANNLVITAPENAAYLIVNDEQNKKSYIGEFLVNTVSKLQTTVAENTEFIEPFHVNIADPHTEVVHFYANGTHFGIAEFIYMLPIKVKPNTVYTVMQKSTTSNDFHVITSAAYPVSGGACTNLGTENPSIIKTGANDNYINVIYYNERQDASTLAPDTIMVVEGVVYNFVERNVAKSELPKNEVSISGYVISDEFIEGTEITITSENATTVVITENENLIIPSFYESLTSKTTNGITFTVNDDLSITANGTATGNADFYFMKATSPKIFKNSNRIPMFLSCFTESTNDKFFAYLNGADIADHGDGYVVYRAQDITSGFIRIRSGETVNNIVFKPMLSYGTDRKLFVTPKGEAFTSVTNLKTIATGVMSFSTSANEITVTGYRTSEKIAKLLAAEETRKRNENELKKPYILSAAHRGFLTEAPENTIFAFRAAVEAGVDYLESDIQFTSDGVPVMFHDTTINRVVNGHTGAIADYTWAQVQEFDVYTYFQTQYPDKWQEEFEDARILSLEQYLKMAKGFGVKSVLEIKVAGSDDYHKTVNIKTVRDLINQYDYANNVLWSGSLTSFPYIFPLIADNQETAFALILERVPNAGDLQIVELFNTGKNVVGFSTNVYNNYSDEIIEKYYMVAYTVDTTSGAVALNPFINMAISNSINVKEARKEYYMENLVT